MHTKGWVNWMRLADSSWLHERTLYITMDSPQNVISTFHFSLFEYRLLLEKLEDKWFACLVACCFSTSAMLPSNVNRSVTHENTSEGLIWLIEVTRVDVSTCHFSCTWNTLWNGCMCTKIASNPGSSYLRSKTVLGGAWVQCYTETQSNCHVLNMLFVV